MAIKKVKTVIEKPIPMVGIEDTLGANVFTYKKTRIAFNKADASKNLMREKTNAVFIFDVDPDNDQISNEMISEDKTKVINDYFEAKKKVLIFTSNSRFEVLYKYIVEVGKINTGYLVCNGGSLVYNIETKKNLFTAELGINEKAMIAHTIQMQTLNSLASSMKNDLLMSSNYIETKKFSEHCYVPRQVTDDYLKFSNFVLYNSILSMLCYENNKNELMLKYDMFLRLSEDWNIHVSNINNGWFIITPKGSNKINAVYKILDSLNHTDVSNIFYFALNAFNNSLWWLAKDNHYVSSDCLAVNKKYFSRYIKYENNVFYTDKFRELLISVLPLFKKTAKAKPEVKTKKIHTTKKSKKQ